MQIINKDASWWYLSFKKSASNNSKQINKVEVNVVGVTYDNRQQIIETMKIGEQVWLKHDNLNVYDLNAVCVMRSTGEQIGFVSRELAVKLAPRLDILGEPLPAIVTAITGQEYQKNKQGKFGVRIRFVIPPAAIDDETSESEFNLKSNKENDYEDI